MPQNLKEEAESSLQDDEPEETAHTNEQEKPKSNLPQAPIQGEIKWEMAQTRTSKRNKRKPNWLGQNVMVTKIEATSSQDGESLPSVYEIKKP